MEERQEIPLEVQQQLRPQQQEREKQKITWDKLEKRISKMENRPVTLVSNIPGDSEASTVVIGKSTALKIPTFDETSPGSCITRCLKLQLPITNGMTQSRQLL